MVGGWWLAVGGRWLVDGGTRGRQCLQIPHLPVDLLYSHPGRIGLTAFVPGLWPHPVAILYKGLEFCPSLLLKP